MVESVSGKVPKAKLAAVNPKAFGKLKPGTVMVFENWAKRRERGRLDYALTYINTTFEGKGEKKKEVQTIRALRCGYEPIDRTHTEEGARIYQVCLEASQFKIFFAEEAG